MSTHVRSSIYKVCSLNWFILRGPLEGILVLEAREFASNYQLRK